MSVEDFFGGLGTLPPQAALLVLPAVIVALFGLQYLIGFQLLPLRGAAFRRTHATVALLLGVAFVAHGFGPLVRFTGWRVAMDPLVLPAGLALMALLGVQVLVGYHYIPTHRQFRTVHVTLATAVLVLGLAHGVVLGTAVAHPDPHACESCHRPPASHFAPPCLRCHRSPGIAWSFDTHPRVAGPHTYRSFACSHCHPGNAYSRVYCSCHRGRPPVENEGGG